MVYQKEVLMTEKNSTDKASPEVPEKPSILLGTSKELFPDYEENLQAELAQKNGQVPSEEVPTKQEETPKEDIKTETEVPVQQPDKELDKTYKVKVDGIEMEVNEEELVKGYQTQKALSQRGQKLAEERREFEMSKSNPVPDTQIPKPDEPLLDGDEAYYKEFISPYVNPLKEQIKDLTNQLEEIQSEMRPTRYNTVMEEIDREMKEAGFDDFKEKQAEIENTVHLMSPERQGVYNNKDGYISIFKSMKLDELKNAKNIAPKKVITDDDKRVKPDVEVMDGGVTPSQADDSATVHNQAFERAKKTGHWGDWAKVLEAKGYVHK
jgi:hypothetical protein